MTNLNEIYKCNVCGNIVEVVHTGVGTLVCCGEPMNLLEEKVTDPSSFAEASDDKKISVEKHVPVIEKTNNGILIKIGSVPHPMEDAHYIEWAEIETAEGKICKKYLKPGDKPEVLFHPSTNIVKVRIYCNIHGLWKNQD